MTQNEYITHFDKYPILNYVPLKKFNYDCRMGRAFVNQKLKSSGETPNYMLKKR